MTPLTLTLLIATAAYAIFGTIAYTANKLPHGLKIIGGLTIYRTQTGIDLIDKTAQKYQRFWTHWGTTGAVLAYLFVILGALIVGLSTQYTINNPRPENPVTNPANTLVIPGVNDFLPASVAPEILAGLLIGLVVHELGHGILCRIGNINIDSVGTITLAILPIGAFVEPNEDSINNATEPARIRMYAAGVMNNFALSAILLVILCGPLLASVTVAPGAAVGGTITATPADTTPIDKGDRITHLNNHTITNNTQYVNTLSNTTTDTLTVTLASGETIRIDRQTTVIRSTTDSPLKPGSTITHINNTPVTTTNSFTQTAKNHSYATLTTANNTTTTTYLGALAYPQNNTPAANAFGTEEPITILSINNTRITTTNDLTQTLDTHNPGDTITITAATNNTTTTRTLTLDGTNNNAHLGVIAPPGTTGMQFTDTGVNLYPAEAYLGILQHGFTDGDWLRTSPIGHLTAILQFPAAGTTGVMPYNFAGFIDGIENFYTTSGPLAPLGTPAILALSTLLFWVAWVNINLGIFNCIPMYPLDGGHLINSVYTLAFTKLNINNAETHAKHASYLTTLVMLAGLVLIIFGPRYLLT